jgi:hypothetical protein
MTKTTSTYRRPTSSSAKKPVKKRVQWLMPWTKQNYIIMAIGLGVIVLGYILMSTGITEQPALPQGKWNNPFVIVAPILLVLGYCVILPFGIFKSYLKKQD